MYWFGWTCCLVNIMVQGVLLLELVGNVSGPRGSIIQAGIFFLIFEHYTYIYIIMEKENSKLRTWMVVEH